MEEHPMEVVKNIAAVIGCMSAGIGLIITIFKPVRQYIVNSITRKEQETNINLKLEEIQENNTNTSTMLGDISSKIDKINTRIDNLGTKVLENEADRLRSELFTCGNRCRRGIKLHPEEYDHILDVYTKYSETLHKNGSGKAEMDFIRDYYNKQSFPMHHQSYESEK